MWLAIGIVLVVAWLFLYVVFHVAAGLVHLLLFVGALFLIDEAVRWRSGRRAHAPS
jgi:membrane protein YdbS with pleckstrin-like domain